MFFFPILSQEHKVKPIIQHVLETNLAEQKYDPVFCRDAAVTMTEVIKERVQNFVILDINSCVTWSWEKLINRMWKLWAGAHGTQRWIVLRSISIATIICMPWGLFMQFTVNNWAFILHKYSHEYRKKWTIYLTKTRNSVINLNGLYDNGPMPFNKKKHSTYWISHWLSIVPSIWHRSWQEKCFYVLCHWGFHWRQKREFWQGGEWPTKLLA